MSKSHAMLDELIAEIRHLRWPLRVEGVEASDPLMPGLGAVPNNRQALLIQARAHGRRVVELIEDDLPEMAEAETALCAATLRRVGVPR